MSVISESQEIAGDAAGDRPTLQVCFVTGVPPGEYSGATIHAMWLAERMKQCAVDVEFLTLTAEPNVTTRRVDGFPFHHVWRSGDRFEEVGLWRRFDAFFRKNRQFDLIHVHSCGYPSSFSSVAARRYGIPGIATVMIQQPGFVTPGRVTRHVHRWMLDRFERIVPISEETYDEARAVGFAESRLEKIPISVDVDRFKPVDASVRDTLRRKHGVPTDRAVVTYVGALCGRKNIAWLTDNWMTAESQSIDAHLLVVGDAADADGPKVRAKIEAQADSMAGRMTWIPFVQEIEEIYALSDVLVLPSKAEGMPTVVLQAMSTGVPVLVTPVSGAQELVGPEMQRGRLFGFGDSEEFWNHLRRLLGDASLRATMGHASRSHMLEHYSIGAVASRYRDLYDEVLRAGVR